LSIDGIYDADWFRAGLAKLRIRACIPSKTNRKTAIPATPSFKSRTTSAGVIPFADLETAATVLLWGSRVGYGEMECGHTRSRRSSRSSSMSINSSKVAHRQLLGE
jgi:hypothetical protein